MKTFFAAFICLSCLSLTGAIPPPIQSTQLTTNVAKASPSNSVFRVTNSVSGMGEWILLPTSGGSGGASNAITTIQSNGVDVATGVTNLNFSDGTNIAWKMTNSPAGLVSVSAHLNPAVMVNASNLSYAIGTAATNYTDSRSVAASNLSYAIGTSGTNYTDSRSVNASNLSYAIGTAATNYTDSRSANLTNQANANSVAASNLSYAIGSNDTNYVNSRSVNASNLSYSIGASSTNYTDSRAVNLTNQANANSVAASNLSYAIGTASTNYTDSRSVNLTNQANANSVAASNLSYAIGTASTNYTDSRSVNASNLSYVIGTNGTNYTDTASSNRVRVAAGANIFVGTNGSGGVMTYTVSATNVSSSFGSMTMSTGTVTTAASAGPNKFTNFFHAYSAGSVATISNTWIVVTNGGNYDVSFGSGISSGNGDTINLQVFTNGPGITPAQCNMIFLTAVMPSPAVFETGFKRMFMFLPDGCHVFLATSNSTSAAQTLKNTVLTVSQAQSLTNSSGGGAVAVQSNGVSITSSATAINFVNFPRLTNSSGTISVDLATNPTSVWNPSNMAFTPTIWFIADSIGGSSNSAVSAWSNSGLITNALSQSSAGSQPVIYTGFLNGHSTVLFAPTNASTRRMVMSNTFTNNLWFEKVSAFAVINPIAYSNYTAGQAYSSQLFFGAAHSGNTNDFAIGVGAISGTARMVSWSEFVHPNAPSSDYTIEATNLVGGSPWLIVEYLIDGSASYNQYFYNGSLFTSPVYPMSPLMALRDTFMGFDVNFGQAYNGFLSELMIFNDRVGLPDRQLIEGYLAWKYGIQTNLPSSHPFRNSAP